MVTFYLDGGLKESQVFLQNLKVTVCLLLKVEIKKKLKLNGLILGYLIFTLETNSDSGKHYN